jgi:hypothetical protein
MELTPRNLITRKFISNQIHSKPPITDIAIPIPTWPGIQAYRGVLTPVYLRVGECGVDARVARRGVGLGVEGCEEG